MARTSRTLAPLFFPSGHSYQPAHQPLSVIPFVSVFVQVLFWLKDLEVYSSPSSCIYSRCSSSSQQSPSRPSSFQATSRMCQYFVHLCCCCSCRVVRRSCSTIRSSRLPSIYCIMRAQILPLPPSWTCLLVLRRFTLSSSSTTPSNCDSPFTLL